MSAFKYKLALIIIILFVYGLYLSQTGAFVVGENLKLFSYYATPVALLCFLAVNQGLRMLRSFSFFFIPISIILISFNPATGALLGTLYLIIGSLILFFKK